MVQLLLFIIDIFILPYIFPVKSNEIMSWTIYTAKSDLNLDH